MDRIGLAIIAVGLLVFFGGSVALSSTGPVSSYYQCNVTSQTQQIVIVGCDGTVVGPEPDGSYYVGFGVSFQWCAGAPSPTATWTWANGTVQQGPVVDLHEASLSVTSAKLVLSSSPAVSASMSASALVGTGQKSFSNPYGLTLQGCPAVTTTTTSAMMTSTTSTTSTSTTSAAPIPHPPSSPYLPMVQVVGIALIGLGGFVTLRKRGR